MNISGASRTRARQGICVLRQGILGHFRPLLDIFGAKGLFKDTFLFEGRGCILTPSSLYAPLNIINVLYILICFQSTKRLHTMRLMPLSTIFLLELTFLPLCNLILLFSCNRLGKTGGLGGRCHAPRV